MALWLILTVLQGVFIVGSLLGQCAAKKKKNNGEPSEKVKTKNETPNKKPGGAQSTYQQSKIGPASKMDDGYENCDDMTNEELAKIAAKA